MNHSLLFHDYVPAYSLTTMLCAIAHDKEISFIEPQHIIKSSVGEFYQKNMKEFINLYKDVFHYLYNDIQNLSTDNPIISLEGIHYIASQLLPLGATSYTTTNSGNLSQIEVAELESCPIAEVLDSFNLMVYVNPRWTGYRDRSFVIERMAEGICVGYTPMESPLIEHIKHDGSFMREYCAADTLYPFVTQPLKQLRMLIPSMGKDMIDRLIKQAVGDEGSIPNNMLDFSNNFTFDISTDFISYTVFRNNSTDYSLKTNRQVWHPFFGANNMEYIKAAVKDAALIDRIEKAFVASKRLYIEMLKTEGIRHEAQYAVLAGFKGRFILGGTYAGMTDLPNDSFSKYIPDVKDINGYIKTTLDRIYL